LFPTFSVVRFGRFNGTIKSANIPSPSPKKAGAQAYCFEFEFYYEDCPGGLTVDGTRFPVRYGFFTCCKPGQHKRVAMPYKCFFFNIATHDPELENALKNLPNYAATGDADRILSLCKTLIDEKDSETLYGKLLVHGCISTILSILFRNSYTIPDVSDHKAHRHQAALLAANEYLMEHLQENLDLKKLARDSGLHYTYFHKLFSAAYHRTPAKQLMLYRVRAAMRLLQTDELTISEISAHCGFSTPNYFCRIFKETCGSSPSQYRKTWRKKRQNS